MEKRTEPQKKPRKPSGRYVQYIPTPEYTVSEENKRSYNDRPVLDSAENAFRCLENIRHKKQEHFALLTIDGARRLIKNHIVTVGTLTASLVHPREIFALALEDRAASIIIAHNHPSGILAVSEHDRKVTKIVREAGSLMNIPLDDHLVVTGDSWASAMD